MPEDDALNHNELPPEKRWIVFYEMTLPYGEDPRGWTLYEIWQRYGADYPTIFRSPANIRYSELGEDS